MTKKNEVAEAKNNLPAMAMNFDEDAGQGYEEADRDSFAIPFIAILQALSPQVDESEGAYIEGAKQGMFMNTVTSDVFDGAEGLELVPVHYSRAFTEWGLRENGGGFKGEHAVEEGLHLDVTLDEKKRAVMPNGNQIVDTRNHYVLVKTKNGWQPIILSFTSTQLKKSRKWMTSMNQIQVERTDGSTYTPPMFAHHYKMTTVKEKNDQGSWFGYKIERLGFVESPEVYEAAKAFREVIKSGEAKAAHESVDNANTGSTDSAPAPKPEDDDIPGF